MSEISSERSFKQKVYEFLFPEFFRSMRRTKKLAYLGIFVALAVVANFVSFNIGGGNNNKLSFVYTMAFLTGSIFGSVGGFVIMLLGDFLGFIIRPDGVYSFVIGFSNGMLGLIFGLIMCNLKIKSKYGFVIKLIVAYVLAFSICTIAITSVGNYIYLVGFWAEKGIPQKSFYAYVIGRIAIQSIVVIVNYALSVALGYALDAIPSQKIDITGLKARRKVNLNASVVSEKSLHNNVS